VGPNPVSAVGPIGVDILTRGKEGYHTGSGEAPGVWLGAGAARLRLCGPVDATTLSMLSMLLAGMSPEGEVLLARRADPSRRVAGLDLTFSAPKSVSILYGLGDERVAAAVRDLHEAAVADALGYLERRALRVRRGAGLVEFLLHLVVAGRPGAQGGGGCRAPLRRGVRRRRLRPPDLACGRPPAPHPRPRRQPRLRRRRQVVGHLASADCCD